MFGCIFATCPCGILGQVWFLIVLIPDLCHISYRWFIAALKRAGLLALVCDVLLCFVTPGSGLVLDCIVY